MPDPSDIKVHAHPHTRRISGAFRNGQSLAHHTKNYAELCVTSNFTFLTGASHPDEFVEQAKNLGYVAITITDKNSLAGIVRGHVAAKQAGIWFIVGCRLVFTDPVFLNVLVYPTSCEAYGRLCRLLTLGKRAAKKGQCHIVLDDLLAHHNGLLGIVNIVDRTAPDLESTLRMLRECFDDDRLSLAITRLYGCEDNAHNQRLIELSQRLSIPLVAINDAHYHVPERRALQDVLTCIRRGCTLMDAGFRLFPNGERYLKSPDEMARLFVDTPQAVKRTVEIAERAIAFNLDALRYEYPHEVCPPGMSAMAHLEQLTWQGANTRYPKGIPQKVRKQLHYEFKLIKELAYAHYFLTVHDLVRFARSCGILCQGRGAAANSAVCYCLGVTSVDPDRINVLFERFVSRERDEPPDIDIDFEHERREEVIQYIYEKYGRDRAGLTAEVITYRARSAVRDVGKALGLSLDAVDRLAKRINHWVRGVFEDDESGAEALKSMGFDPQDRAVRALVAMTREIVGFPRHLSQHVGGFVITNRPLCELVPIENAAMPDRTVIEWDKDDIDAMGMLKVDVLGLGMLTCIRKALALIEQHHNRKLTLATIPPEKEKVYDMICKADTLGVFQIESRAQMTMLPRLRPKEFYDLVIQIAIVRPGPIIGNMVHPYLRRRNKEEKPYYPDDKVRSVLEKTLGVPLFQEQAMSLAIVAAGFTPGEAEQLRRAITAWKSNKMIAGHMDRFLRGMIDNGYSRKFAEWSFQRMKGFSEYGFPESHAASFALLAYASSWLKCYYPAAFAAALINSQPMGFYAPAQIIRDAQDHGVTVHPVDVNHSDWDCTLEDKGLALRLGMRLIKGLRRRDAQALIDTVAKAGLFSSVFDLWHVSGVNASALRPLARADAFRSMGLDRQQALWQVQALRGKPQPLIDHVREECASDIPLPEVTLFDHVGHDYATVGLSLKAHPISFLRDSLKTDGVLTAAEMKDESITPHGRYIAVAGLVLFRQRPATAKGVMFMTLEDETGRADLIVKPRIYERFREALIYGKVVLAKGRIERRDGVVHLMTYSAEDVSYRFDRLPEMSRNFR